MPYKSKKLQKNKNSKQKTNNKKSKTKPKYKSKSKSSSKIKSKTKSNISIQKGGFKKFDFNNPDRPIKLIPEGESVRKIFKRSGVGNPPKISCVIL